MPTIEVTEVDDSDGLAVIEVTIPGPQGPQGPSGSGGGGALSDGDYGDIVVSGAGTVMTYDGTVPVAKGGTGQTTEAEALGEMTQALTEDTTPAVTADYVITYDASADTGKKIRLDTLALIPATANTTFYVRTDGSDSNSGLVNDASGAFLTIQKAVDVIMSMNWMGLYSPTISVADGTYDQVADRLRLTWPTGIPWSGNCFLTGNIVTPANVIITSSKDCIEVDGGVNTGGWIVRGFKLTTTVGTGITIRQGATCYADDMSYQCGDLPIYCQGFFSDAWDNLVSTITGSSTSGIYAATGGYIELSATWTLVGTPAFSAGFMRTHGPASQIVNEATFSGSATGKKFNFDNGEYSSSGTPDPASLPGSTAGEYHNGAQVNGSTKRITVYSGDAWIEDYNDNEIIKFPTVIASAVNELTISNAATGTSPIIEATGGDTDVGITFKSKGAGDGSTGYCFTFDCGGAYFPFMRVKNNENFDGGPSFEFFHDSASPALDDFVGGYLFRSRDSLGNSQRYASLGCYIIDPTSGSEDARLIFDPVVAGVETEQFQVAAGVIVGATTTFPGAGNMRVTNIEIGNDTDTTLARSSAGNLSIEGNVIYRAGGTDVPLADGGTGASLSDPNLDRIMFWDDSAGTVKFAALADITTEASPAAGDYVLIHRAEDDVAKVNFSNFAMTGKQAIWIPALAMTARTTNGAASGTTELTTNKVMISSLDFDTATQEFAQFAINFPPSWDGGNLSFIPVWSHAATATNFGVVWGLGGVLIGDDDSLDQDFSTPVTSTDTGGVTSRCYEGPESSTFTITQDSPLDRGYAIFQLNRTVSDAGDDLGIDARLHGILLFYNTNAGNDA